MFYCHLSAFSRQTVYNKIISSWQYPLIIRMTIAIVHSIVSRIILLFQLDYLIKSPFVSMLGGQRKHSGRGVEGMLCSCHPFGMLVPRLWHDCAKHSAQSFQRFGIIVSVGGTTVLIACHKPYGYLNGKQRKEKCWWQCEWRLFSCARKRGESSSLQSFEWHSRSFLIGIRLNDGIKWWQKMY